MVLTKLRGRMHLPWALACGAVAATLAAALLGAPSADGGTGCAAGSTVNVIAHQDDDLLFQNPDVSADIAAGACVTTLYATAGDANENAAYWQSRERGAETAYARMAGVADDWRVEPMDLAGHTATSVTLEQRPGVRLVYLRLPDGQVDGGGGSNSGFQSLQKLWTGEIPSMTAVDGSGTYTKDELLAALGALFDQTRATTIRTLDFGGEYGDGDHSDHHTIAFFARQASEAYAPEHRFLGYLGYPAADRPENLDGAVTARKTAVFFAYAALDRFTCADALACSVRPESKWLPRQYTVGQADPAPQEDRVDLATSATLTASSENAETGQTARKAVDGVVDGFPGDYTKEWAAREDRGWLELSWPNPVTLDRLVLCDRPNAADQVTAGTLTFSENGTVSTVTVGALGNTGEPTVVDFPARTVDRVRFTVDAVSDTTEATGLAEIQALGPRAAAEVVAPGQDVAGAARATASSESTQTGQRAAAVLDGVVAGFPADPGAEWATVGGREGSWLQLDWPTPVPVDQVVLHDRPNADDQVLSGTLLFSDGTTVQVGALENGGAATPVRFPAKVVTSVRFTVDTVSPSTRAVGLAEIAVTAAP
jgi:LmbE family N-acetylglucosaminyl deacetylase